MCVEWKSRCFFFHFFVLLLVAVFFACATILRGEYS